MTSDPDQRLHAVLGQYGPLAIAVSGGVDSMLLAHAATRSGIDVQILHAASPAVPAAATERVREHALRHGWDFKVIDAGELSDERYSANPVNRCFFCKERLYSRMRSVTDRQIASGANMDDLGDYRPGLDAARHAGVVHPYVDAAISKGEIYAMARAYGLKDIAALPAQPCLASRMETGIPVTADALYFIEEAELSIRSLLPHAQDVRCRITAAGVAIELNPMPDQSDIAAVSQQIRRQCEVAGYRMAGVREYSRGSAFLRSNE